MVGLRCRLSLLTLNIWVCETLKVVRILSVSICIHFCPSLCCHNVSKVLLQGYDLAVSLPCFTSLPGSSHGMHAFTPLKYDKFRMPALADKSNTAQTILTFTVIFSLFISKSNPLLPNLFRQSTMIYMLPIKVYPFLVILQAWKKLAFGPSSFTSQLILRGRLEVYTICII